MKIKISDKEVFSQPLSELFKEESVIGRALEKVPAVVYGGDPLLGCLIRSGCSVAVGQIISCKKDTAKIRWGKKRLKAIGQCLRRHIPNMLIKMATRAVKCVVRFGF